mmetsp:Transcript_7461/g.24788  ORF Transcript_7461/g.24788 Transcript_7461/m.24788 type:complete len:190 (-) Transcript_7461:1448-2017(-)
MTQRELYYHLKGAPVVTAMEQVARAVQDAVALLRVPRASLGIHTTSRGLVAGLVQLFDAENEVWLDCAFSKAGMPIAGDINYILRQELRVSAQIILVVEKEAVFNRLLEDQVWFLEGLSCCIITGRGQPDLGTRVFLHRLHQDQPAAPVLGLVDWNPDGLSILCTYKVGSDRMPLEAPHYGECACSARR